MNPLKSNTLILSGEDVQNIVRIVGADQVMDDLISRLESALKTFDPTQSVTPVRDGFNYNEPKEGLIEWMPLYNRGEEVMIKVVGYHPFNPATFELPTIISSISSYDTSSGHLMSLMDGVLLTALRTGASSAVASKYLAQKGAISLGIIGCGAQGITQVHALSRIFELKEIRLFDVDKEAESSFARRCESFMQDLNIVTSSLTELVELSEIIVTATSIEPGAGPLFENIQTLPNVHINAVGSDFPGKIELPKSLLQQSVVCPDFIDQAVIEGECQQLDATEIGPDLVQLVQNNHELSELKEKRTVFDSTGWALEDEVGMKYFLEKAQQHNLGTWTQIEDFSTDAKNPYHFLSTSASEVIESKEHQTLNP